MIIRTFPTRPTGFPTRRRQRIQAWEEAPMLDEIAVNAGYRGTLVNLGLINVGYHQLNEYLRVRGGDLAGRLGIKTSQLEHLCRVILDEIRTRGCLSREMLRYHPVPHEMSRLPSQCRVGATRQAASGLRHVA